MQVDVRRSKKRVFYVLRHLHYCVEVCEADRLCYANAAVNAALERALTTVYGSWTAFNESVKAELEGLRERLRAAAAPYQAWEARVTQRGPLIVQEWLRDHGGDVAQLQRVLCVRPTETVKGPSRTCMPVCVRMCAHPQLFLLEFDSGCVAA